MRSRPLQPNLLPALPQLLRSPILRSMGEGESEDQREEEGRGGRRGEGFLRVIWFCFVSDPT